MRRWSSPRSGIHKGSRPDMDAATHQHRSTVTAPHTKVCAVSIPARAGEGDVSVLSVEELARADRFWFERDRSAFVTTRAALRRVLALELDVSPRRVTIVYESTGRPALAGISRDDLDFNVSHAASLA